MTQTVHIVGAGLAGLSCAIHARARGLNVKIYEASPQAGGRIKRVNHHDNATHLLVKAYQDSFEYLEMVNTLDQLVPLKGQSFDMREGPLEWSVPAQGFFKAIMKGCVPGVNIWNILGKTAHRRIWDPLILAIFNTTRDRLSKKLAYQTLKAVLKAGPDGLAPYLCKNTLYDAFVAPALAGIDIRYNQRLLAIKQDALIFNDGEAPLGGKNQAVLALPHAAYQQIVHPFDLPTFQHNAITNIHFYLDHVQRPAFFGMVNSLSQWVHAHDQMISVTLSNHRGGGEDLAKKIWREICFHFDKAEAKMPPYKIVCEKKATPVQDPYFVKHRPTTKTNHPYVFLAGDGVNTQLPATIESAIKSGKMAANALLI